MQLRVNPAVQYDAQTNTYAAWCTELSVATSAPSPQEAKVALVDAMRVAAEFVTGHSGTIGQMILRQAPYADLIAGMTDQELAEAIVVRA
jgi:hypothetical protein